jgi:hypothetical protein
MGRINQFDELALRDSQRLEDRRGGRLLRQDLLGAPFGHSLPLRMQMTKQVEGVLRHNVVQRRRTTPRCSAPSKPTEATISVNVAGRCTVF